MPGLPHGRPPLHTGPVRCGADNPEGNSFCGTCGLELYEAYDKVAVEGDDGAFYCYRHKRESTRLTCGRCGKPICTRCAINGPAGIRCPECAKQNIAFRPMGLVSDVTHGIRNLTRSGPYTIYIWIIVASLLLGSVRGCMFMRAQQQIQERHERVAPHGPDE